MKGTSHASASALAADTPTSSAPISPGPTVHATASMRASSTLPRRSARAITGLSTSRCARDAISGTTPPKSRADRPASTPRSTPRRSHRSRVRRPSRRNWSRSRAPASTRRSSVVTHGRSHENILVRIDVEAGRVVLTLDVVAPHDDRILDVVVVPGAHAGGPRNRMPRRTSRCVPVARDAHLERPRDAPRSTASSASPSISSRAIPWRRDPGATATFVTCPSSRRTTARHTRRPDLSRPAPVVGRRAIRYRRVPERTWAISLSNTPCDHGRGIADCFDGHDAVAEVTPTHRRDREIADRPRRTIGVTAEQPFDDAHIRSARVDQLI